MGRPGPELWQSGVASRLAMTFDPVVGVDFDDASQQSAVERYLRQQRPVVAIMAPT